MVVGLAVVKCVYYENEKREKFQFQFRANRAECDNIITHAKTFKIGSSYDSGKTRWRRYLFVILFVIIPVRVLPISETNEYFANCQSH